MTCGQSIIYSWLKNWRPNTNIVAGTGNVVTENIEFSVILYEVSRLLIAGEPFYGDARISPCGSSRCAIANGGQVEWVPHPKTSALAHSNGRCVAAIKGKWAGIVIEAGDRFGTQL
jgi:hypothetical protein